MELEKDERRERTREEWMDKKERENLIESIQNYVENFEKRKDVIMVDTASVDRIENKIAVCELLNGQMVNISLEEIPFSIREGDILKLEITYQKGNITKIFVKEKDEEEKRRREEWIQEKIKKIKK